MIDYRWQSKGGLLLDNTGDIAFTDTTGIESLVDMIRTRLKAAIDGWQLYNIGADLQSTMGTIVGPELELTIQRQVSQSLTNQFLRSGDFQVRTLAEDGTITVFVYINNKLIASAVAQRNKPTQVSSI